MGFAAQALYAASPYPTPEPKAGTRSGVVSFTNGRIYLAAGMTQSWSSPVVVSGGTPARAVRTDIPAVGAIYDNGKLVLSSSWVRVAPQLAGAGEAQLTTMGAILVQDRLSWLASVVRRDTEGARNAAGAAVDSSALGLMLGADYGLSRRTALYARAGEVRNFGASTIMLNGIALPFVAGSTVPQTGIETRSFSLGLLHHF
jgi:predicted porin